jgi:hypothetical protein
MVAMGRARKAVAACVIVAVALPLASASAPAVADGVCDSVDAGRYVAADPALQYPGQEPEAVATALPASFTSGIPTDTRPNLQVDVDYSVSITDMDGNQLTSTTGRNGYCWTAHVASYPSNHDTFNLTCAIWRERGPCFQAVEHVSYTTTHRITGDTTTGSRTAYVDLRWLFDRDLDHVPDGDDACPDETPSGPDRDRDGCIDPPACPEPTVAIPPTVLANAGRWLAQLTVSDDDGLVAQDVRLSGRRLAASMTLPYVELATSAGSQRIELRPNGSSGNGARVRLVGFDDASGLQGVDVRAIYAVDWPTGPFGSCLYVTQRYRFNRPMTKAQWNALPGGRTQSGWCNPTQTVGLVPQAFACGRFYPTVNYRFVSRNGEAFTALEAPQRLRLQPGSRGSPAGGRTGGGLFEDCDTHETARQPSAGFRALVECLTHSNPPHPVIEHSVNPLERESTVRVVRAQRQPGSYDNYHCQLGTRVFAPGYDGSWNPGVWGCPNCVHIHWRWGTGANYAPGRPRTGTYTDGSPMVNSQNQTVDVSVTTTGAETIDPVSTGWRSLAGNRQPVGAGDQVFWYVGRSTRAQDTFFTHGGFFADL